MAWARVNRICFLGRVVFRSNFVEIWVDFVATWVKEKLLEGGACVRALGAQKRCRPGKVGTGCDALVLGLHAAHDGEVQERSAVPRSGQ